MWKSLHQSRHFFHLLTRPRFGELNRESDSFGSQPFYRKLFPRGPHSSKNNFFDIKISRPTSIDSLSVLLWLLTKVNVIAKSQHFKLNSRNISDTIKYNKYSEESHSSNSRGDTGGRSPFVTFKLRLTTYPQLHHKGSSIPAFVFDLAANLRPKRHDHS